ncbi:unnamed protein product [marine sediment metagenome]|uniref:Uncharacterized protein n=1 Tax=marine sediment metagenome TaxID=412755 RepID=X1VE26_9ZZZZ
MSIQFTSAQVTPEQVTLRPLVEGALKVDEIEYAIVEAHGSNPFRVMGYVDLYNLTPGDRVVLREYMMIKKGGEYRLYAEAPYENEQGEPLVYVESKVSRYGIKVTIHQVAGDSRVVDFQFFETKV